MAQQLWVAPFRVAHIADGAAYNTSTTLTDISPTPNLIVPANYLTPGMTIRVTAGGRVSTTGTPTLNLGVYVGAVAGTALGTTGAITMTSGVTNVPWRFETTTIVRTDGSSGTTMTLGWVHGISGTVGVSVVPIPAATPATVTWDTTSAKALTVGATWGTNSASNTITCHYFIVETIA